MRRLNAESIILVWAFLGILLGIMFASVSSLGYFVQWLKLPPPPARVSEILNIVGANGAYGVSIKTIDGKIYVCNYSYEECWVSDQVPSNFRGSPSTVKPCNYSRPEFFFVTNPPQDSVDCIQGSVGQADGGVILAYEIDKNGEVWEWSHASGIGVFQDLFNFSLIGLFSGIIIGWIVASRVSKSRKQRRSLDTRLT
jgi:hypothetical protein